MSYNTPPAKYFFKTKKSHLHQDDTYYKEKGHVGLPVFPDRIMPSFDPAATLEFKERKKKVNDREVDIKR
jgi:hypothetical protein